MMYLQKCLLTSLYLTLGLLFAYSAQAQRDTSQPVKDQPVFLLDNIYKVWNGTAYKWGFHKGKEPTTKPLYDTLIYRYLHDKELGYYRLQKEGKWGLLHENQSVWVPIEYDALNYRHQATPSYIAIQQGKHYGILDTMGKVILEANYDDILSDGYTFKVKKGEKVGIYSLKGKELIPVCFDKIRMHPNFSYTMVRKDDKWSVFNWIKDDPCNPKYAYKRLDNFSDYYVVLENGKYGLLDIDAKEILPIEYQFLSPFFLRFLNTLLVGQNQKVGLLRIDAENNDKVITEIPIEYNDIWVDKENMKIKVRKGDRIDYYFDNQTLFDLEYNDVKYYADIDRVMVKKKGKWGMVKVSGELMIPIKYDKVFVINKNMFMVEKKGKFGVVNARGREMLPVRYEQFDFRPDMNIIFISQKGQWGIATLSGGVILPPKYEDVIVLKNKHFLVKSKEAWGVLSPNGRVVVPIEYSYYKYKPGKDKNTIRLYHPNGTVKDYKLTSSRF